jgi:hypothetical protein
MLTTSMKKFLNRVARIQILSGFTKVLLKRVSFSILLGMMVFSSFSVSKPASAATVNDWTYCATEGDFCNFTGTKEVRYGENGTFDYKVVASNGIDCSIAMWLNDPVPNVLKHCEIRNFQFNSALTAIPSEIGRAHV